MPPDQRPSTNIVHVAFDLMVGAGFFLLAVASWLAWSWRRKRDLPLSRWFMRGAILAGPAAAVAIEAGWVTTELGRQPWTVYGILRTDHAVSTAPGLFAGFYVLLVVYTLLTVSTLYVLRRMSQARRTGVSQLGVAVAS